MSACTLLPFPNDDRSPETLAELLALVEEQFQSKPGGGSHRDRVQRNQTHLAGRRIAEALGHRRVDTIRIEELVDVDTLVREYATRAGLSHGCTLAVIRKKNYLLQLACDRGWTSPRYALLQGWLPVRAALRGHAAGSVGIVGFSEDNNIPVERFADSDMEKWKNQMFFAKGLTLQSVLSAERNFRSVLRKAGLQRLFPRFSLASREVSHYTMPLEQMNENLRKEILKAVAWKTAHRSKGRSARGRLRPSSQKRLLETIQGLCAYATFNLGICGISSLRQVLSEEIVCGFIDWLQTERGRQTPGILTSLRYLQALVTTYPLYKSRNYKWLPRKLKSLPREPKWALDLRKKKRAADYSLLEEIPEKLQAEIEETPDPVRAAWLARDRLLVSILLQKPFRNKNLRTLTISSEDSATVCQRSLPPRARRSIGLSAAARKALEKDPERKFWVVHFNEDQMKGKKEVWWLVPRDLVRQLTEYLKIHRPRLIGSAPDPQTLFVNKARRAMSCSEVAYVVAGLCMRYLRRPLTPHDFRRVYSTFFLAEGGTMEELQQELGHNFIETTCGYCAGFDASYGVVVLEAMHDRLFARSA